jgi:polyisoprenyl-phosphate glycosyltransferase
MDKLEITVVISLFNEEEGVEAFWQQLHDFMNEHKYWFFELIWVNDGSKDKTQQKINNLTDLVDLQSNYSHKTIEFSRNFGHEAAMIAGIDYSEKDLVICMDADSQHPVTIIKKMVEKHLEGNDIVLAIRKDRADHGFMNKMLSRSFYNLINKFSEVYLTPNSSDFFLISRKIKEILKSNYREHNRLIRGFIQSIGFEIGKVEYIAPAREAGKSKYSIRKLASLALNSLFAFSNKPLRISLFMSFIFIGFSLILIFYSLFKFFTDSTVPSGYTTLIIFVSISFAIFFFTFSVFLMYFEKTLTEVRNRPLYIIKKINNL